MARLKAQSAETTRDDDREATGVEPMICPIFKQFLLPQCAAKTKGYWYAKPHQCRNRAIGNWRRKKLCGVHLHQKKAPHVMLGKA